MRSQLDTTTAQACQALPRSYYARDCVTGRQRWSGGDLKGKAKRFGAGYERQRSKARAALFKAGGRILAVQKNRCVTAVRLCVDDYGNEVFDTPDGLAWPKTRAQYGLV